MRVTVIGGGVVGLAVAWSLARRDVDVELLERGRCGGEASAGNAGWVTPGLSAPLPAPGVMRQAARWMLDGESPLLVRPRADVDFLRWSLRFARSCRPEPHRAGTRATLALGRDSTAAFDLLRREGVEFEMHDDGLLYLVRDEARLDAWLREYDHLRELGFDGDVEPLDRAALRVAEPGVGDGVAAGLLARRERHVRPETVTAGLCAALRRMEVAVHEDTVVTGLAAPGSGGHGAAWQVRTHDGATEADAVVVAAGVWSRELLRETGIDLPLQPAKGYSVTAPGPEPAPRRPLYLTEAKVGASPFGGGVLRLAGTLELSGVETSLNRRRVDAVVRSARPYLRDWEPGTGRAEWAGLRPLTCDGVPVVGEARPGLFVATGHAMLGVTLAPATGEALAPMVMGERPPDELAALGPARIARGVVADRREAVPA